MLTELFVRDLGIIGDLRLVLGPGMTAFTGETGAGKTLLVQAIELLLGGRADAMMVRAGADEAVVEGRFVADGREVVLGRAVPAAGRSRAYLDGRMVPVSALAEAGAGLVDLHGQHAHQSLLAPAAQRAALDAMGVDLAPLREARRRLAAIDAASAALGGDERALARETDLLQFQVAELAAAGLGDPGEDGALAAEEDRLADVAAHREAAVAAQDALAGDGGAVDDLAAALAAVAGRSPLAELEQRLRALAAEADDVASELRVAAEALEDDPQRLAAVRARRVLLRGLCRKYGDSLEEVLAFAARAEARLGELQSAGARAEMLAAQRREALGALRAAEAEVRTRRRALAPALAGAVAARLGGLAMAGSRFEVAVGEDGPGDDVRFLLAANPGEAPLPLARVASGGELARTMLALRLALQDAPKGAGGGPAVSVFDEVDAGIGGEAARAVGRALAALAGPDRQVLVVTHLPQVAAFADHQVAVSKVEHGGRAVARAEPVAGRSRVVELSRMLSGSATSAAAHGHAEELLAGASLDRPGSGTAT
ncbi:MAG TPA: DNA repair protein RecN [Acidimicrobiales bacterium]|nr:DNA repair protein RecN [Acidimicrobiales bacterium]